MLTKFVVAFSIFALIGAVAGTVPAKAINSNVTLTEPATIHGAALKAGDYRVVVTAGKVTFIRNKETHEVPATVETTASKFFENEVQYEHAGAQTTIKTIGLGGTKTRLVFN